MEQDLQNAINKKIKEETEKNQTEWKLEKLKELKALVTGFDARKKAEEEREQKKEKILLLR